MSATAFKNAIRRREHYERSQPAARSKYGLLEKHKDYVQRARNFHDKEKRIAALKKKAANRNPDEFSFKMVKAQTKGGIHVIERDEPALKGDMLKVLKTQDKGYVQTQKSAEDKKIEKLQASLHLLAAAGGGGAPPNRHTVFVDDADAADAFSPAAYFNTDPDLVGRAFNRPRMETLEGSAGGNGGGAGVPLAAAQGLDGKAHAKAKRARERSYVELEARLERSSKLAKLGEVIDRDREMLKKGRRVKVRVPKAAAGGDDDGDGDGNKKAPAVFKWKTERKR